MSRRAIVALLALAAALIAAGVATPMIMVATGTRRAIACFAQTPAPRGPALAGCRPELRWFSLPSRVPWTRHNATYRAEELAARAALTAYLDAAVGSPDRAALSRAATGVEIAANVVAAGSQRLSLEDLGPSMGAPHLGREAARLGDRSTLLGRAERWADWHVRVHTLHAAIAEADLRRAASIAEAYAAVDPRDDDLRTTVAAVLCLAGDAKRGMDLLAFTQSDRATRRYAAMARNWGDVRALLLACAAIANATPPPKPEHPEAGEDDRIEVRAAQELRVATARGDAARARRAIEGARDLLASSVRAPASRLGLLAVVLAPDAKAAAIAALARPRLEDGEGELSTGPLLAMDWLPERGLTRPQIAGPALAAAAERAADLAAVPGVAEEDRTELLVAAGALAFEAARELAAAGDAPAAIAILDRYGALAAGAGSTVALALAKSSAWYVAGDPERALEALGDPSLPDGAPPAPGAALALQRAQILASLGRRGDAARAAALSDDGIAKAGEESPVAPAGVEDPVAVHPFPVLDARARWMRLALTRPPEGAPLRAGTPPPVVEPPGSVRYPWPWVGFASPATPWSRLDQRALSLALAGWDAARAAPSDQRRALRYAALSRRGDAPPALAPYLSVAAELLGDGEGDVEIWLDAFLALDARRFSHREIAFARAEAALWRGDRASAEAWRGRYEKLRAVACDPERAEIARFLGI
jgi:hypothetical protein